MRSPSTNIARRSSLEARNKGSSDSKSVTVSPGTFGSPQRGFTNFTSSKQIKSKNRRDYFASGRVGEILDGYVVREFPTKMDNLRDWERDCPVPESISEVAWKEDGDTNATTESQQIKTVCGHRISGVRTVPGGSSDDSSGDVDGKTAVKGYRDINVRCKDGRVSDVKNIAPRGKSWMIVTPKMMEDYYSQ